MGLLHVLKTAEYRDNVVEVSDQTLKDIHNTLLEMMKDIVPVLEKYNIEWSLTAGSMLGAVRHNGFIPWDDDLDIVITREGYHILEKIFDRELSGNYRLMKPGDKGYLLHYPQIQRRNTVMQYLQSTDEFLDGVFIDMFILENTFDNSIIRGIHGVCCSALLFIDSCIRMKKCKNNIFDHIKVNSDIRKAVNKRACLAGVFGFFSFEKWLMISDRVFSIVNKKSKIAVIPSGAKHFFGEVYKRNVFFPTKIASFEGINIRIPLNPEKYLTMRYGNDYNIVPDYKERERHIYIRLEL